MDEHERFHFEEKHFYVNKETGVVERKKNQKKKVAADYIIKFKEADINKNKHEVAKNEFTDDQRRAFEFIIDPIKKNFNE